MAKRIIAEKAAPEAEKMRKNSLEILVKQLSRTEVSYLVDRLQKKLDLGKPRSYIVFPITETHTFGIPRTCVSKADAIRHLNEVILQNCDKKSTPTIKAQVVDAISTLAEVVESTDEKVRMLTTAAKFILITERDALLNKLVTLAM